MAFGSPTCRFGSAYLVCRGGQLHNAPLPGAHRVSQVLKHFSPGMPRSSWTPADLPEPHPKNGSFVLASSSLTPSPSAPQRTTPLLRYYRGYIKSSAYAVYLWPTWFSVYASAISFGSFVLLHNCNTRYGLVVSLCPIGSFTLQEMGSFTCRTNGLRYPRVGGVWIRSESRKSLKPEKSLENAADSHPSGACCVGRLRLYTFQSAQ
jgi:hypothetical protein